MSARIGYVKSLVVGVLSVIHINGLAAGPDSSQQVQQLNSQIQTQLQQIQETQQKQMKELNTKIQSQLQQMKKELDGQIQTVNTQTQKQLKQVQDTLQAQIKQVQADAMKAQAAASKTP
ncbi:MAG: hypothetical protein CK424_08675 [Legionella sp.]|nr:MAG: hypothetical protein CK424_08675 [Legionella sp.]